MGWKDAGAVGATSYLDRPPVEASEKNDDKNHARRRALRVN